LYVIAGLVGLAAGVTVWYITSRWIASSLFWVEHRYPQVIGTRTIKASEVIVCGLQVLACLALAIWVARLMIG
jgi:cytosine/uracil/thiamine/allantoin permease